MSYLREERPLLLGLIALGLHYGIGADWLAAGLDVTTASIALLVLFPVALVCSFGVVRHADILAAKLGEPYGTLILTVSVISIEVALIAAVMLTGDSAPTLARDTMFAVLMIVLNGFVGVALLVGGLRHHEQDYSLPAARSYMSVLMPLAIFALVLPTATSSTPDPTFEPFQAAFFAVATVLLYGAFLAIQTVRHRSFFEQPSTTREGADHEAAEKDVDHVHGTVRSLGYHALLLVATLMPVILLSKPIAKVLDFGIASVGAPVALGGVLIALLVLTPECVAALKAASDNKLQRSMNLLLGSALATIGLTLPAVLAIGLFTDQAVTLGLGPVGTTMLVLTLALSTLTFGGTRTSVLQGTVHIVLFVAYLVLIFRP